MRNYFVPAALLMALFAAVAPSVTSAAVTINFNFNFQIMSIGGSDQTWHFEVFARDLDNTDERLDAYTVAIQGDTVMGGKPFGDPAGVRFSVPAPGQTFGAAGIPVEHPYVFKDFETVPPIENFDSTPSKLQFAATAVVIGDEVDITPAHDGLLRFGVIVPADTPFSIYRFTVTFTALGGLGAPILSTAGEPAFFGGLLPEPSAAALLLAPALALLRRRRGT